MIFSPALTGSPMRTRKPCSHVSASTAGALPVGVTLVLQQDVAVHAWGIVRNWHSLGSLFARRARAVWR